MSHHSRVRHRTGSLLLISRCRTQPRGWRLLAAGACLLAAASLAQAAPKPRQHAERQHPKAARAQGISSGVESLRNLVNESVKRAEESFWQNHPAPGPLVEAFGDDSSKVLVTFFYRGSGAEKEVILECNAILSKAVAVLMPEDSDSRFSRINPKGDTWYFALSAPSDLRTTYRIRVVGPDGKSQSIMDPMNPETAWSSNGYRVSALVLPDAPAEPWLSAAGDSRTSWMEDVVPPDGDGEGRAVWIHLPPGYEAERSLPYPIVIALNRYNFRDAIASAAIVDGLIRSAAIPPVVLAVTDESPPDGGAYASTAGWIGDALLPRLRSRFRISGQARDVVLAGASRRGLVAASVALERSDAVGNVLSLSGAFYWRPDATGRFEWLSARYANHAVVPVRYYLAVGTMETVVTETNQGHYPLATSRHFADLLQARGYDFLLEEFAGTHDELNWGLWFGRGLIHLLGSKPE